MVEVVVCRHGEDLAWTRNLPQGVSITIYDKTPEEKKRWPGAVPLKNVGREAHAWLHHFVERYDTLADWTIFAQGRPFDHAPDMHHVIRRIASGRTAEQDFLWLGFLWETDDARGHPTFVHWTKNPERRELDLERFFQALWGESAPTKVRYVGGGQFAVSRAGVQKRPQGFYEKARTLAEELPDSAHAFERTWDRVFFAPPLNPLLFGESGMRLTKRIKCKATIDDPRT